MERWPERFFDVRVTNTHSPSQIHLITEIVLKKHEQEKKRDYNRRITLNKIHGKYEHILLAGDFYIDELTTDSDSSNHLSDVKDVFNLTNVVKKPTCFKSLDGTLNDLMLTNRQRNFLNFLKSQNVEIEKTFEKNRNL